MVTGALGVPYAFPLMLAVEPATKTAMATSTTAVSLTAFIVFFSSYFWRAFPSQYNNTGRRCFVTLAQSGGNSAP
jgi:hypothetical protein